VTIVGLSESLGLNGHWGYAISWAADKQRYVVKLPSKLPSTDDGIEERSTADASSPPTPTPTPTPTLPLPLPLTRIPQLPSPPPPPGPSRSSRWRRRICAPPCTTPPSTAVPTSSRRRCSAARGSRGQTWARAALHCGWPPTMARTSAFASCSRRARASSRVLRAACPLPALSAVPQRHSAAARQRGSAAARQRGSAAARQRGSAAARQRGSAAVRPFQTDPSGSGLPCALKRRA
jgi:hypothetical protein